MTILSHSNEIDKGKWMTPDQSTVWILEDDRGCQFVYEQTLDHRYKTVYFSSLREFTEKLEAVASGDKKFPQMIVADLMLEDGNFLNYLTSAETEIFEIPFIIVSSIDDIDALRFCFKEGALDYLTKPFKKNELLVKIENVLRSPKEKSAPIVEVNPRSIKIDGKTIDNLTTKQIQLMSLFLNSEDRSISREDILQGVWGKTNVHPKTVDVHLYNLRRKIQTEGYIIRSDGGGRWSLISDRIDH